MSSTPAFRIFPLIVNDATGKIEYHYFKSIEAKVDFESRLFKSGYRDGYSRHKNAEEYALLRSAALNPEGKMKFFLGWKIKRAKGRTL